MIDRTPTFRVLAPSMPRVAGTPGPFAQVTSRLHYEISRVEAHVRSDDVLASSELLQQRFVDLNHALVQLQTWRDHAESQPAKHMERVKASLEQRLKDAAKVFTQALEARAQTQASKQERHEQLFGQAKQYAYKSALPPSVLTETRRRGPLLRDTYQEPVADSGMKQALEERKRTAQERSADALKVEKTINEVGQLFLRVAGLVDEQKTMLDDIEANVEDTTTEANEAQGQLLKLFRFVSGDRKLIVGILVSVTVVGCIIIYFLT